MTGFAAGAQGAQGFTVWLTGLRGAGKGSIAQAVAAELARRGMPTELLAGGEFRQNISRGLGFSRDDRIANVRRIGYVAKLLTRNGVAVVTTAISPNRAARDECRRMIGRFVEVWVQCPLEVCEARDTEGLYRQARLGLIEDFTGIADDYEPPEDPELVVHSDRETAAQAAARIVRRLEELGYVPAERGGDPDEAMVKAQLKALQNR
ncbi:adenylyl-sulfate kinase [Longimicrobium sp.]|uniref:adenylyl-sulfate kinase n=1 Tax=Longimicrobium sp. TaxID=2029185 RepID=UPI002ED960DB